MHKSVSGLQSVEPDTSPGCEIIFPDLVIADFESEVMKNQQNHEYAESFEDICMAATAAGRSNRKALGPIRKQAAIRSSFTAISKHGG